jgi:SOS response regulatory protein OraA/RecX
MLSQLELYNKKEKDCFGEYSQNLYNVKKVKIPKPELYVIYTGERGNKPEVMSLSADFFDGADTSVEVKAKVIYESESDDIINQYIIFSKVFDEQRKKFGYTRETVEETIRICKDRNVLKQYLESKEKEVTTIMMSLFDEEQILTMYVKDKQNEARNEARLEAKKEATKSAKRLLKKGLSIDDIAECLPQLSYDELRQIEAEVMSLA